jgi:hypothetical protein
MDELFTKSSIWQLDEEEEKEEEFEEEEPKEEPEEELEDEDIDEFFSSDEDESSFDGEEF